MESQIKIVTYGIPKSGSSFLTQVSANALKIFLNETVPITRFINYCQESDHLAELLNNDQNLIVKTHLAAPKTFPATDGTLDFGQLASVRDPREIALSHFDHSQRNWKQNPENPGHPRARSLEESIRWVKQSWSTTFDSYIKNDDVTVFFYEEVFDTEQYAEKVLKASHINIPLNTLTDVLSDMEVWQMNMGVRDRVSFEEPSVAALLNETFDKEADLYREALKKLTF